MSSLAWPEQSIWRGAVDERNHGRDDDYGQPANAAGDRMLSVSRTRYCDTGCVSGVVFIYVHGQDSVC